MMENIHSETYSLLVDTYIKDSAQHNYFFDAIETNPHIKAEEMDLSTTEINHALSHNYGHMVVFVSLEIHYQAYID